MKNNRRIKFRVWDKVTNRWLDKGFVKTCAVALDGELIQVANNLIGFMPSKDYVLMQFTGLLDKNGKEIYEGDILKVNGVVEYEEGAGGFLDYNGSVAWIGYEISEDTHYTEDEVIGNIFSNPELLEENNG